MHLMNDGFVLFGNALNLENDESPVEFPFGPALTTLVPLLNSRLKREKF